MSALTKLEATRLGTCETAIAQGLTVFVEVGRALTEIRDGKLYRATHKTFEAYCKDRWEIGRSRAYDLIDQAKVTKALIDGGVDLSASSDISIRDARALKDDPSAASSVKTRVDAGEKPSDAIKAVVVEAKEKKAHQQADFDQQRLDAASLLPPAIQAMEAAKAERRTTAEPLPESDDSEELRNIIADQAGEIADLQRKVAKFDDMAVEFEQGGFENVITGLEQRIEVLKRQVERESQEKVKNLRGLEYWKKKAIDFGANADVVIDMATGDITRG